MLGEYDQNGNLIQELVWLNDIPVATIRTDQGGSSVGVFYIHTDHLNAPTKITRPSDNAVIWRWDHDPFGNGTPNQDPDGNGLQLTMNIRFAGQYYDSETGLYQNYFRDCYDPTTGRYCQPDPIGLAGGLNPFAYVGGNPISYVDPLGLSGGPSRPTPQSPPPDVSPEVKAYLCKLIKECKGDFNCVYNHAHGDRKNIPYPGGPPDPKTWNDPILREAEDFATAASPGATEYPLSWGAHNAAGITIYQWMWKPPIYFLGGRTSRPSSDAYWAGMAGRYWYGKPRADAMKWCNDCEK